MSKRDEEFREANRKAAEQREKMRRDMDIENKRLLNEGINQVR